MALFFALVCVAPGASANIAPFVLLFGTTYFFSQFAPNTTTFVYPSEIFPVDVRTTGNGIAAGIAKIGAFAGAAVLPALHQPGTHRNDPHPRRYVANAMARRRLAPKSKQSSRLPDAQASRSWPPLVSEPHDSFALGAVTGRARSRGPVCLRPKAAM